MPIITFSSDAYQNGRLIAEKTAESLGYSYVDREILKSVAKKYHVSEVRLIKALDELPSFMGISSNKWKRYLAYIQEAVMGELLDDNVVTHGVAAHLYLLGISHVLKVRILLDHDERVKQLANQKKIALEKAKKIILRQEKQQKRWSLDGFQLDETDPSLYDMVVNISQIDPEEAVRMISTATGYRKFKSMTYSLKCMQDRELASRVRAVLLRNFSDVKVQARDGTVVVEIKALKREKQKKAKVIKELTEKISGVRYVEIHLIDDILRQAVESGR